MCKTQAASLVLHPTQHQSMAGLSGTCRHPRGLLTVSYRVVWHLLDAPYHVMRMSRTVIVLLLKLAARRVPVWSKEHS